MYVSIKQYKLVPANGSDALKFEGGKVTASLAESDIGIAMAAYCWVYD